MVIGGHIVWRRERSCTCQQLPSPEVPRSLLLPEHNRPGNVLTGSESSKKQAPSLDPSQIPVWRGRAHKPEYKPVHRAHTTGCSGTVRFFPGSPHMPRSAFPDHQWLPQLDIGPLCLRCSGIPWGPRDSPSGSLREEWKPSGPTLYIKLVCKLNKDILFSCFCDLLWAWNWTKMVYSYSVEVTSEFKPIGIYHLHLQLCPLRASTF